MKAALVLSLTILSSACAPPTGYRSAPPPVSRAVVTSADFARFPGGWNAFEALSQLRPEFLSPVAGGFASGQSQPPTVIVNGVHRGGIELLRGLQLAEVVSMRYYRSLDATTRFGPRHTGAVIDVRLRGGY